MSKVPSAVNALRSLAMGSTAVGCASKKLELRTHPLYFCSVAILKIKSKEVPGDVRFGFLHHGIGGVSAAEKMIREISRGVDGGRGDFNQKFKVELCAIVQGATTSPAPGQCTTSDIETALVNITGDQKSDRLNAVGGHSMGDYILTLDPSGHVKVSKEPGVFFGLIPWSKEIPF